jgi:1-acyl-sn-glycerol-3-phosphate acyltransferase
MEAFYWFVRSGLKLFFSSFYRFRVFGTDHVYKGGAILAPNHTSYFDPPLISVAWPEEIHYLARATLFHSKPFSWLLRKLHAHPVHGSAQDLHSFKIICKLLEENKQVVIFPEGLRSEDGQLQPIKPGVAMLALRTRCPIIPIYIQGAFEAWPIHQKWPRFGSSITCVIGEPIFPGLYSSLDKKQAQEALSLKLQDSLEKLRLWLETKDASQKKA